MNVESLKGISLTSQQIDQLTELRSIYEIANSQVNVISRKDMDQFYTHHVLHSIAIAHVFAFRKGSMIMDLGCGGGFPGIPLAIVFPEVHFFLVDSIGKKIKVVTDVAAQLSLKNVEATQSRAESIRGKKFDGVVSRAVAPLKELWRWSVPLLRHSSNSYGLICLKGGDLTHEIKELGRFVNSWEIFGKIYSEEWFREKFILQVKP